MEGNNVIRPVFWGSPRFESSFDSQEPPIHDLVESWLESRKRRGVSDGYLETVGAVARKFARSHERPLSFLNAEWFHAYLRQFEGRSARTRNNHLAIVRQLIRFARVNRWIPRDWDALASVEREIEPPGDAQIYTPEEIRRLLEHCTAAARPVIVLVAFCGLRVAEALRLTWEEIRWDAGHVALAATKAKTRARRICPIADNAREWLKPDVGRGLVFPQARKTFAWALAKSCREAELTPRRNGLRHSFISYRVALTGEAARTALEAGTSEQMVFRNYREVATSKDAEEWFSVRPDRQLTLPLVA